MADVSIAPTTPSRKRSPARGRPLNDRTGHRFGFLTALSPTHRMLSSGREMPAWLLRCDCGKEVVAMTVNLAKGKHWSCGCQKRANQMRTRGDVGVTSMPEYSVYRQMLDRCYLITAPNYRWYGAKGVEVCHRWRHGEDGRTGFLCFLADMGPRPKGLTIDRIDPFLNYGPDNCRWTTWAIQGKNRRSHHNQKVA